MTEFPLDIVTPDGEIFSGRAESLRLRSIEGDLCIRARHTDYVTALGMGPAEVQATIRTQTRLVFFLPLAAALLHLAAAMPMMHRLLKALSLNNPPLFVACTAVVALVFTVVYYLIYRFTARVYYRIVRR